MKNVITILLATLFLFSCNTAPTEKGEYLKKYGDFMKEIKENRKSYTEEQWKTKDKEFEKYSRELYEQFKNDLGILEQGKVIKHQVNYAKFRGLAAIKNISEDETLTNISKDLQNVIQGDEIKEALDGMKNVWNEDTQKEFENAFNQLKSVWNEDTKKELSSSFEEIQKILNDKNNQAEINAKIKELEAALKDDKVKGQVKDAISELKNILEKAEKELEK